MFSAKHLPSTDNKNRPGTTHVGAALVILLSLSIAACQAPSPVPATVPQNEKNRVADRENEATGAKLSEPQVTDAKQELEQLISERRSNDQLVSDLFQIARTAVSEHFDTNLDEVELKLAHNEILERYVQRETAKLSQAVFSNPDFADLFLSTVMEDQSGTYAGLYVSPENLVVINRELLSIFKESLQEHAEKNPDIDADSQISQGFLALLIHELVHAADNKRFQIHANRKLNFRSSVAQSAVFEGHAQLATREICKQLACTAGLIRLDSFMFEAPEPADPVARSLQAVSRNVLEYAYVEGERFLTDLKNGPNGLKRLEAVLRNPPEDPVQILDPDNFPNQQRIWRNEQIFERLENVEHHWNSPEFAFVETSPIKGLDLRKDPERRAATKEGFTRLIQSMVGAQLFNQRANKIQPIEITVMQTDTEETAKLFSRSFFEKAARGGSEKTRSNTLQMTIGERRAEKDDSGSGVWPMKVFLTVTEVSNPDLAESHHVNLVANAGNWIIQMGGLAEPQNGDMISFSEQAMLALLRSEELEIAELRPKK